MSNQVEFIIKTKADLNAAKQVEQQLEKDIAKLRVLGTETDKLAQKTAQLQKVRSSLAAAPQQGGGAIGEFASGIKDKLSEIPGVGKVIGALSGGAAAGLAAIAAGAAAAAKGLEEFAVSQERVTGLDAALAQTGQLTDEYREKLQALAAELQVTSGIADDEWIGVLKRLTQFGSTAETIERDTEAVKNLAGIMGGDLASASQLIARANQGQFQAFSRMGIVIDENGTKTEKLSKLYEELAQRGGGQLEARSRTLTGQFGLLKATVGDFFEAIGRGIASTGILQTVLTGLTDTAAHWADVLGGVVPKVDGLTNATKKTTQAMDDGATAAEREAKALDEVKKKASDAADQIKRLVSEIEKQKSDADRVADAKKNLELARIDKKEKDGANPIAAADARAEVEFRYAAQKQAREEKAITDQMDGYKQAAIAAEKEVQAARAKLVGETAKAASQAQRDVLDRQIKLQQDNLEKAEQALDAAVKQRNAQRDDNYNTDPKYQQEVNTASKSMGSENRLLGVLQDRRTGFASGDAAVGVARENLKQTLMAQDPVRTDAVEGFRDMRRQLRTSQTIAPIDSATLGIRSQITAGGAADTLVKEALQKADKDAQSIGAVKPELSAQTEQALRDFVLSQSDRDARTSEQLEARIVQRMLKILAEKRPIGFN